MTIIIGGIFAGGLYAFFFASTDAARSSESQARAQGAGRLALSRFTRDVRQAISPDNGLTPPIESVGLNQIVMYVDPSRDPAQTEPRPEKVRYRIDGQEFVREAVAPVGATAPYSYGPFGRREVLAPSVASGSQPVFEARTSFGGTVGLPVTTPNTRFLEFISIRLVLSQRNGNSTTTTEVSTNATLRNSVNL